MADTTIPAPTAADLAREPTADLAVCEMAPEGPWINCGDHIDGREGKSFAEAAGRFDSKEHDDFCAAAHLIAMSREALPAYIRRAHHAEAARNEYHRLTSGVRNAADDDARERAIHALIQHATGNGWLDVPPPLVQVITERAEAAVATIEKLQAFKSYVHARLDAAGVPADPESPHRAEGCRVGGRLDWLLERLRHADALAVKAGERLHATIGAHAGERLSFHTRLAEERPRTAALLAACKAMLAAQEHLTHRDRVRAEGQAFDLIARAVAEAEGTP